MITAWLKVCNVLKVCLCCRHLCVVILNNRYIHLHAVSRLAGTNCSHKPGTIETAQSTFILNALFCKTINSKQLAYQFDYQFISTFRCIGMMHVNLHLTCDNILHNISKRSEWRFRISVCGLFFLQLRYPTVTAMWSASTILIYIYMQ